MNAIVAVDQKWGIGCGGELLFSIPEDMKFFKNKTENKVVVMGHWTLKSLPGSKPLKNRVNIVLSKNARLKLDSVIVCNCIEQLLSIVSKYNPDDVFVIGGQELYSQLLDYCSHLYVTKVNAEEMADRFFPNIDLLDNWIIEEKSEDKTHNGLTFAFYKYANKNTKRYGENNPKV